MAAEKRKLTVWAAAQLARLNALGLTRWLIEEMPDATRAKLHQRLTITINSNHFTLNKYCGRYCRAEEGGRVEPAKQPRQNDCSSRPFLPFEDHNICQSEAGHQPGPSLCPSKFNTRLARLFSLHKGAQISRIHSTLIGDKWGCV